MFARLVALLLLVIAMTGAATAASTSDGHTAPVVTMADNTPDFLDLDPVITVRPLAMPAPTAHFVTPLSVAPQPPTGRLHAVLVFRPPR